MMKKNKKQIPEKPNESQSLRRRRFALSKIQENRDRERTDAEQQRNAVFTKRLRGYSSGKAPRTLRTKGYYRFNKDYPMTVDGEGFRENSASERRVKRRAILIAAGIALAFVFSFVITKTCVYLSGINPAVNAVPDETIARQTVSYLRLTREEITGEGSGKLSDIVLGSGCSGAIIEVKDEEGNIYLDDFTANAVKELKADGIETAAYISCFKDSLSPDEDSSFRIRKNSSSGELWTDNSGSKWLNPFSESARALLLYTVSAASELGFRMIALDNVGFPSDSGSGTAYFFGENEWTGTRNQLIRGFISDSVSGAGNSVTAIVCSFSAFDAEASAELAPYYGNLLNTGAGIMCADARLSRHPKNVTVGTEKFTDPSEIPYAFILTAGDYAVGNTESEEAFICFDRADSGEDAVSLSGASGCIIW